jgi:uncharacterized Fe-S center protein
MASTVYFIKASIKEGKKKISDKAVRLFKAGKFNRYFAKGDFTAVKVHIGEEKNTTFIPADCIKGLVNELVKLKTKPFITDTSTLYTGRRHNAIEHTMLAAERGFDTKGLGVPFIAPDGLFGTSETAVKINGQLNKEVLIASDIVRCQSMLTVAHFTGHIATCMGATLKTLGMGCSSRKGKMRQHSVVKPLVKKSKCTRCGECTRHCPVEAIVLLKRSAYINPEKCIGCAECVAVCRFDAIKYDWGRESRLLQQDVAEHALGVLEGKKSKAVFFNFLLSITADCDCFKRPKMSSIVPDIGILASDDPVAVDTASLDFVETAASQKMSELIGNKRLNPRFQLEHAEFIGLGSRKYTVIEVA